MSVKVEKTENTNEVKLSFEIEAEKFDEAMKKYMLKLQNILIYQVLEKEKHQCKWWKNNMALQFSMKIHLMN